MVGLPLERAPYLMLGQNRSSARLMTSHESRSFVRVLRPIASTRALENAMQCQRTGALQHAVGNAARR